MHQGHDAPRVRHNCHLVDRFAVRREVPTGLRRIQQRQKATESRIRVKLTLHTLCSALQGNNRWQLRTFAAPGGGKTLSTTDSFLLSLRAGCTRRMTSTTGLAHLLKTQTRALRNSAAKCRAWRNGKPGCGSSQPSGTRGTNWPSPSHRRRMCVRHRTHPCLQLHTLVRNRDHYMKHASPHIRPGISGSSQTV